MFTLSRLPSWSSLSRGAAVSFGLRVAGAGLLYALHIALARWMDASGYGAYVYAISWASVLAEFGALGLPSAALRFVPEYQTAQHPSRLRGFVRTSRGWILAATGGLALLATGVSLLLPVEAIGRPVLWTGFALAPLMALLLFETEVLRACNRFAWSFAPNQVLRPLGVGGGAGLLLWTTGAVAPLQVLACTGAVFLLMIGVQRIGARRALAHAHAAASSTRSRRWLQTALPLLLVSGFQLILRKTDVVLLGALVGPAEVGIYFAALRTAQIVTFVGFAVDAVAAPLVSRLYHGESDDLQATISRLAHWYLWPTLATAAGLAFVGVPILSLFGAAFTDGYPVMLAFMGGLVVNAAAGVQTHLLTLTGNERSCAWIFGACAALNVGLNLVGIATLGALGAALATATSLAVRALWIRRRVVRLTGLRPTIWGALRP